MNSPKKLKMDDSAAQPADASTLWIVAIILMKQRRGGNIALSQSVSWRMGVTEGEARGQALKVAMKANPDFAVHLVTVCREDRLTSPELL